MCADCRRRRTPARYRRCQRADAPEPRRRLRPEEPPVARDAAPLYVTRHAVERLAAHHEGADVSLAVELLAGAIEVDRALAAGLAGRALEDAQDHYLVTSDARGMFVVVRARPELGPAWVVVTYLRLGGASARVARELGRRAA